MTFLSLSLHRLAVLALTACILINCPPLHAGEKMKVIEGAPEGFETLDKPRASTVVVYFGGDLLGTFPAQSAPGTLMFDNPAAITEKIPTLIGKEKVAKVLGMAMPAHADRICAPNTTQNCGNIDPEIAGVIYNEDQQDAELFINRQYLSAVEQNAVRYLPLPERRFSSIYGFNGAISGVDNATPNFALTNNSTYAYGEGKLSTQSTLSNEGLRFDQAAASVERNGWAAMGGLFRSRGMRLIADRDMAGFSFATSMQTRLDNRKTEGNDILLFLPRRAYVSIYREGRLYSSQAYESGNQYIDTSALPEGAYTITLKIQEADGRTREEKRFFAKSPDLPPPDAPVYYGQVGFLRKAANNDETMPQITASPIARGGTIRRLDDNLEAFWH
jgi:hypothetical protein